jgi:excisionase family DNA binding protein
MNSASHLSNKHVGRRLASVDDAARYCGVGSRTVRRWISNGYLTGYRLGNRFLRVDLNEVDEQFCRPIPTTGRQLDTAAMPSPRRSPGPKSAA